MVKADKSEAIKKQYRYLQFMCRETLDHLTFVNSKVKDVEGFWLSTFVRQAFLHVQRVETDKIAQTPRHEEHDYFQIR
jgi:hypothetical protein